MIYVIRTFLGLIATAVLLFLIGGILVLIDKIRRK